VGRRLQRDDVMRALHRRRAACRFALVLLTACVALGASGCSAAITTHTATNPSASFDRYRTFSFGPLEGPPTGYGVSARSVDVQNRLRPFITSALTQRGYTLADGKGDFFVMVGSGRRRVDEHDSSSVGGDWLPDDENADFVEGSIVVDAFDSTTNGRVWHGVSVTQLDNGRVSDDVVKSSVTDLLASFPKAKVVAP
jgi:Domain of unknown function (DUF4136)